MKIGQTSALMAAAFVLLASQGNAEPSASEGRAACTIPSAEQVTRMIEQARSAAVVPEAAVSLVRYSRGGASFDGWIEMCHDELGPPADESTRLIKCVYVNGRITETYRNTDQEPRLTAKWFYDARGAPILSLDFDDHGREISSTVAQYDQRGRLSELLFVYRGLELSAPAVRGVHRFSYYTFADQGTMVVQDGYGGDGQLLGTTIWRGNDVWSGGPEGDLRLINHGTREHWIRMPERHGLAPFYPLDQQPQDEASP